MGGRGRMQKSQFRGRKAAALAGILVASCGLLGFAATQLPHLGKQPDGSYLVSSGQRIVAGTIHFKGRPSDIALHPGGQIIAVLSHEEVFLTNAEGVLAGSQVGLGSEAAYRGILWSRDGTKLYVSTSDGFIQTFTWDGTTLGKGVKITLALINEKRNPRPGGMTMTADGKTLFVACLDLDSVVEVDLSKGQPVNSFMVGKLPFEVKLTSDEKCLVVSNWGGRLPKPGETVSQTGITNILVDKRGAPASGTLSLVDRQSARVKEITVGIHPTALLINGNTAYVTNSMSDTVSEIDLGTAKVTATIPMRYGKLPEVGAMPDALAIKGDTLYVSNGGDNDVAEVNVKTRKIQGFRPAGFFPISIVLHGDTAFVLNSKGNGSTANTGYGRIGNVHDFEGTISVLNLSSPLTAETAKVVANNHWNENPQDYRPNLAVYKGAIQHVIYIIKENRTYDEIFGDMPQGNGDPTLCSLGERVMPNHRALAREFTLFDNGYVSGTNSADGHAWSTQSIANDYLEHMYVGYRTYPDDGDCAMSISTGGGLWDAAAKKHKTFRDYGEFCDDVLAEYLPYRPKDWFEAWADRQNQTHKFTYNGHTRVAGLKPFIAPKVHYWPLIQSDQSRADEFLKEYSQFSAQNKVPNLMMLSLCCDHSEGTDPSYPAPESMMADNDLALGRVVDAVSHSPQWKSTAIFVIEDDAQSGPDHVDGHRTAYMVLSPYNKRHTVDSNLYTGAGMVRSIELMLGLDPMTKFDALAKPIDTCFNDVADVTPYSHVPNNIPLDTPNPGRVAKMTPEDKYWAEKTKSLDWSHPDGPDSYWLNRIIWYSLHKGSVPYPARAGEAPGQNQFE